MVDKQSVVACLVVHQPKIAGLGQAGEAEGAGEKEIFLLLLTLQSSLGRPLD
ncbi:hypothetical protein [Nostoc parmelioides]|uniref:Uncharacterized protein n=1 Tax=Nostoc parmelioides FACHB-3921 TaxID=2692909 RepID=A0ABR8BFH3_9NOSO|nr:hypothetical protein [Nostoc parmelioides]MBD2252618.1 hypothetical protein [Nostoc parmelioides FACHB-3921]